MRSLCLFQIFFKLPAYKSAQLVTAEGYAHIFCGLLPAWNTPVDIVKISVLYHAFDKLAVYAVPAVFESAPAQCQLSQIDGLLLGLDTDFLKVINPVKVQVAANTVTDSGAKDVMYDKFWLPSIEEMYGSPQAPGIEGAYLPYVKAITGLENPSNDANAGRIAYALENHNSAQSVRLRSANRGNSSNAWIVNASGTLYNTGAGGTYRSRLACAIS